MASIKKINFIDVFYKVFLGVWLMLMLVFSGDFSLLKALVLLLLIALSLIIIIFDKPLFDFKYLVYMAIWLFLSLSSYFYGVYNGFEFSVSLFLYMIVTPIICFVLSSCINKDRMLFINEVLLFSTLIIIIISLYYIAYRVGMLSMPSWLSGLNTFGGSKIMADKLEVRLSSQPSLIFLVPYLTTMLIFKGKANKFLIISLISLSFLVVIFSGRRALQLLFFLGFFINILLYNYKFGLSFNSIIKIFIGLCLFVFLLILAFEVVGYYSGLSNPLLAFITTITSSFDSTVGGGVQRYEQAIHLWKYFTEFPLFGHGLNSHPSYLRNIDEKWSYEWVYLALLSQSGVLYFIYTFGGFFILASKLLKRFKNYDDVYFPIFGGIFNGFVCFLIAGATNPMFYFSWFWFLAFIIFNDEFWKQSDV
ncbi:hypothetical protein HC723_16105 [Vibrio sp. S11_S32]|uniref:hypothetical protein n=1 Tax=Vibrio sp. S11_S32 TaxID=2720225 RepID=UPI001681AF06|nr:hypothetical protein [Vibrio sp. S11_S32]MBD1577919.1 hypothetical protein [Vibrio sp. S11_S32]